MRAALSGGICFSGGKSLAKRDFCVWWCSSIELKIHIFWLYKIEWYDLIGFPNFLMVFDCIQYVKSTSAFWIGLRHMKQHILHGDVRENIRMSWSYKFQVVDIIIWFSSIKNLLVLHCETYIWLSTVLLFWKMKEMKCL